MTAGESPVDVQARLDGLTERAQAATPGPWQVGPSGLDVESPLDVGLIAECYTVEDAAHIAGADPETVLWLVDLAKEARKVPTLQAENEQWKAAYLAQTRLLDDTAEALDESDARIKAAERGEVEAERDRAVQRVADLAAKVDAVRALADARGGEVHQKAAAIWPWELDAILDGAVPAPPQDQTTDEACLVDCPTYRCPTTGEIECAVHGGFDVCCDHPRCPGLGPRQQDGGA